MSYSLTPHPESLDPKLIGRTNKTMCEFKLLVSRGVHTSLRDLCRDIGDPIL